MLKRDVVAAILLSLIGVLALAKMTTLATSYDDCAREQEANYSEYEQDDLFSKTDSFVYCEGVYADANSGAITAVATIALFFSTVGLWLVTNKNAAAAMSAADIAREALNVSERAFVSVVTFQYDGLVNPSTDDVVQWSVKVRWQNSGKSPTKHLVIHASHKVVGGDLPEDFDFPDLWNPDEVRRYEPAFIGPQALLDSDIIPTGLDDVIDAFRSKKRLFAWGWAEYNDILPHTLRHRTEFCVELVAQGNVTKKGLGAIGTKQYHKHNGADEECFRAPRPYPPPFLDA